MRFPESYRKTQINDMRQDIWQLQEKLDAICRLIGIAYDDYASCAFYKEKEIE